MLTNFTLRKVYDRRSRKWPQQMRWLVKTVQELQKTEVMRKFGTVGVDDCSAAEHRAAQAYLDALTGPVYSAEARLRQLSDRFDVVQVYHRNPDWFRRYIGEDMHD